MKKPRLSFLQILNMSFGFLGIQFGFALQNANVSRIFETLGASIDQIPILWIAAPVTGLIVQPIIGHMSDKTWDETWQKKTLFFNRCFTCFSFTFYNAKLSNSLDSRRYAMDYGCIN